MEERTRIVLSGGGTLGPVTPLLAVARAWQEMDSQVEFVWIGTSRGPERELVESAGMSFMSLSAPKLSRHKWWTWPVIPFHLVWSLGMAFWQLKQLQPKMVMTAGGFTSVPLIIMARMMKIATWVHQLDRVPMLANKIMAPFADRISVTWPQSLEDFSKKKTIQVGGIIRSELRQGNAYRLRKRFEFTDEKPLLLVLGGGSGAASVNESMAVIGRDLLSHMHVLHVTGKGKMTEELERMPEGYVAIEFLTSEMADALDAADLIVSRAGMGAIMEYIALRKPVIFLPLSGAYQRHNAEMLVDAEAAVLLEGANAQVLRQTIIKVMEDNAIRELLARHIGGVLSVEGDKQIAQRARQLIQEEK